MKVKFTNASLIEIVQTINKFSECTGRLAYILNKAKRKMLEELKDFESVRDGLIRKYGEKDENGNLGIKPGNSNYQKFLTEIIPISQETVEIEILQITPEEYEKSDFYSDDISLRDYEVIEGIFVKHEENEENNKGFEEDETIIEELDN